MNVGVSALEEADVRHAVLSGAEWAPLEGGAKRDAWWDGRGGLAVRLVLEDCVGKGGGGLGWVKKHGLA